MTSAGTMSSIVPLRPNASSTGVAINEPSAKPMLPPRAKMLIPLLLVPAARRAADAAEGWNAATPSPEMAIMNQVAA